MSEISARTISRSHWLPSEFSAGGVTFDLSDETSEGIRLSQLREQQRQLHVVSARPFLELTFAIITCCAFCSGTTGGSHSLSTTWWGDRLGQRQSFSICQEQEGIHIISHPGTCEYGARREPRILLCSISLLYLCEIVTCTSSEKILLRSRRDCVKRLKCGCHHAATRRKREISRNRITLGYCRKGV